MFVVLSAPLFVAAGEVVALYHYQEAERIEGPAVIGESVLLQVSASVLDLCNCAAVDNDAPRALDASVSAFPPSAPLSLNRTTRRPCRPTRARTARSVAASAGW